MTNSQPLYATFLREHVESFEELETLMAVVASEQTSVTADELCARTQLPPATIQQALDRLVEAGVLTRAPRTAACRLSQGDDGMRRAIDDLRRIYESDRLAVMTQMSTNALDRVRTSAMRAFARAFILGDKRRG